MKKLFKIFLFLFIAGVSYSQILFSDKADFTSDELIGIGTVFNANVVYFYFDNKIDAPIGRQVIYLDGKIYRDVSDDIGIVDIFATVHVHKGIWKVELYNTQGVLIAESKLITIYLC